MKEVARNPRLDEFRKAIEPSAVDRFVNWLDPVRGVHRMRARVAMALAGGYTGGKTDRRTTRNWKSGKNSANDDILPDLEVLRGRSRDLTRNEPLALGAINTNVANVVGTGLDLSCRLDYETLGWSRERAAAWNKVTQRRFRLWASSKNCDVTRTQNFYEQQGLVYRATLESGDCFVLMPWEMTEGYPFETRLQVIEADRVSNPDHKQDTETLVAGVETDNNGAPIQYWISRQHPGDSKAKSAKWDPYKAFGEKTGRHLVLHLFHRIRPGQTRGVPYLAPVIEHLKMLGTFTEAELQATVISACFSVFIKTESRSPIEGLGGTSTSSDPSSKKNLKLEPGLVMELGEGESIDAATPGRPNGAFDPFVQAILRQVGAALGIPFELLVMHFTSSYSASRAAMLMAWQFFRMRREWLASNFCQPVYEAWMDEQVAKGEIQAPGYFEDPIARAAYLSSEWIGDAPAEIDREKAARAAELNLRLGLTTLEEETIALSGRSWEENLAQRQQEMEAHEAAKLPYLPSQTAQTNAPSGPASSQEPKKNEKPQGK